MSDPLMETTKDPTSYTWITYGWVLMLSILGGFVSFARKLSTEQAHPWNIAEFVGEVATSAFAGLITFYLCQAANLSGLITAALVGITGHMGSRAIFQIEQSLRNRFHIFELPPSRLPKKADEKMPAIEKSTHHRNKKDE
jgi:hypothetical protein